MQTKVETDNHSLSLHDSLSIAGGYRKQGGGKNDRSKKGVVVSLNSDSSFDIEILGRIKKDDINAFESLYKKYYKRLFSYARKFIEDSEIVKDILQDTFSYVWENRSSIKISKSLSTYLFRTVHNRCINQIRNVHVRERYISDFKLKNVSLTNGYLDSENGHTQLINTELNNELTKAIDSLAPQCKRIFKLSRENGLKHKEIAQELSISPKTVEVQIFRALKALRLKLKNY